MTMADADEMKGGGEQEPFSVFVRRHPTDWQTAEYSSDKIYRLRWDSMSGGVGRATSHPALFCYVMCDEMISGELAHSCRHGPPPHEIKVCLVKKLNKDHWPDLVDRVADPEHGGR